MQNTNETLDPRAQNKRKKLAIIIGAPLVGLLLLLLLGRLVGDQKPSPDAARSDTRNSQTAPQRATGP